MDLTQIIQSFVNDDQSWLGSAHGTTSTDTCTLDISKFDPTAFDFGDYTHHNVIPSGVLLGKVTATGKYGPYNPNQAGVPAVNEVQGLAVSATGGTFTLAVKGSVTAAIAYNATAAAVQAALELLDDVQHGDIVVTGGPGGALAATPYVLTFGGRYANSPQPLVVSAAGSLTGSGQTAAVTETTLGKVATAGDGTEAPTGLLFHAVSVFQRLTTDKIGAIFWHGQVIRSKLPAVSGVDNAAVASLIHIQFV